MSLEPDSYAKISPHFRTRLLPKGVRRSVEGTSFSFTPAVISWSRITISARPASFCACNQKHQSPRLFLCGHAGINVRNARSSNCECSRASLNRTRKQGLAPVSECAMVICRCSGCALERARVPRQRQVRTHTFSGIIGRVCSRCECT